MDGKIDPFERFQSDNDQINKKGRATFSGQQGPTF